MKCPKIRPKTKNESKSNLNKVLFKLDDNLAAKLTLYKSTQLKKGANCVSKNFFRQTSAPKNRQVSNLKPRLVQGMDGCLEMGLPVVLSHSWWGRFVVSVVADVVFRSIYRRLSTAESTV